MNRTEYMWKKVNGRKIYIYGVADDIFIIYLFILFLPTVFDFKLCLHIFFSIMIILSFIHENRRFIYTGYCFLRKKKKHFEI